MTTKNKALWTTILALAVFHAGAASASNDARLCRQEVQKARIACLKDARAAGAGDARTAAIRECQQTARARVRACQMRSHSASAPAAAQLSGVASTSSPTLTTDQFDYHPGQTI